MSAYVEIAANALDEAEALLAVVEMVDAANDPRETVRYGKALILALAQKKHREASSALEHEKERTECLTQ